MAEPPRRLSYSLGAGDGQPTTYVTWEIRESAGQAGSRVRLYVDEAQAGPKGEEEAEKVWKRVISSLAAVLAEGRSADASI